MTLDMLAFKLALMANNNGSLDVIIAIPAVRLRTI